MNDRDISRLESRIAELESKLEALTVYCEDLEDRITKLAVAKVPEARFPFWNWQLQRRMTTEDRRRLTLALSALDERARGTPLDEAFRKVIEGVPSERLYGQEPLEKDDVMVVIQAITGMGDDARIREMFEALEGQGMCRDLCRFMLATT